jgi:hypothetical protein
VYSDPAPLQIGFAPVPPEPNYRKHKRIYVSLNITAEAIRQIRLRYAALSDQLVEYDRSAEGRQAQVDSPEERKAYFDMGYAKRHEVIGAAWDLVDWIERFRRLLGIVTGVPHKAAWLQRMRQISAQFEDVRHFAQHFDREVRQLVAGNYPLLGAVMATFPSKGGGYTRVMLSTPVRYAHDNEILIQGFQRAVPPVGDVDCIVFSLAEFHLNFSTFISELEPPAEQFFEYIKQTYGAELPHG